MNKAFFRVFSYILIVVVVFTIFLNMPEKKVEVSPLGSMLSAYFYNTYASKEDVFSTYANHLQSVTDPELKQFYQKFDWRIKNTAVNYTSDFDKTWQQYDADGSTKDHYLEYWQAIRPAIKQFYNDTIPQVEISYPVVHFRCSDAPFVIHPQYHLTKAASARWMAEQVKNKGFDKIVILACNKHRKVKNNSCSDFLAFYTQIFQDSGLKVEKQCNSVFKDFALMVHSPLLVSLNASSFSFMAGISKDPTTYISCNFGRESTDTYLLQTQADWLLDQNEPLLHKNVKDYKNVKDILTKLEN